MISQLDIFWYIPSHPPESNPQLPAALHNSYPGRFHGSPYSPLLVFGRKFFERHMQLLFKDSLIHINESIFMFIFHIVVITIKSLRNISVDVSTAD